MAIEINILEQTVASVAINFNALMAVVALDSEIADSHLTAVLNIERIAEITNFHMLNRRVGSAFHVDGIPAIIHFLCLGYAVIEWEAVMTEQAIPGTADAQIS